MLKPDIKQYLWPTEVRQLENKPVLIQRKPDGTIYALDITYISNRVILKLIAAGTDMKEVYAKVELYYDRQLNSVVTEIIKLQDAALAQVDIHVRNRTPEIIEDFREVHGNMETYAIAREIRDAELLRNEVV